MNRSLHWTLIVGCAGLALLYAQPAWDALSIGVPSDAFAASVALPASAAPDAETDRVSLGPEAEAAGAEGGLAITGSF